MGEVDAGMEYWNRALTLCNKSGDKRNIAGLHAKMAWWLWLVRGNKEKAAEHHRMALEILEKEPESVELASLYEDISHMLWRTGKSSEALMWTQKALELAERFSASDVLAGCYNNLGVLSMKSGDLDKATEYYERGLKIALENKLAERSLTSYNNLCTVNLPKGDFQN